MKKILGHGHSEWVQYVGQGILTECNSKWLKGKGNG